MDDRGTSYRRDRRGGSRAGERPSARRGYAFQRAEHRPVYGGQARRDRRQGAYVVGFIVVVAALAAFLYIGLNWVTGPGRAAAVATPPTPTPVPIVVVPTTPPAPSPTVVERTYVIKAGDNPASIAAQFGIKSDELMAANNLDNPQKLQIGQTLKIPPPSGR